MESGFLHVKEVDTQLGKLKKVRPNGQYKRKNTQLGKTKKMYAQLGYHVRTPNGDSLSSVSQLGI